MKIYSDLPLYKKIYQFIKYKIFDLKNKEYEFNEYGVTFYCGRQGAGKTIALVEYLERMRLKYPDVFIVTNFNYKNQDKAFENWTDIVSIRNDKNGVIFAIDEIQNEFSSTEWRNFPEWLLREVTQQRKQRIKIVVTSQVFTRVAKPLREQAFEVVECNTFAGRWTFLRAFDAYDYNNVVDNPEKKLRLRRLWRRSFVQTNKIRDLYDTYEKIEKIQKGKVKFLERDIVN